MKRLNTLLSMVSLIITICLLTISCSGEKQKKQWDFSFHSNYISDECFAFFPDKIISEEGVITLENTNDFPIYVYLYKGFLYNNVEKKILLDSKEKIEYLVDSENTYYVGIKVLDELGTFTKIGLSVYEGSKD